MTFRTKDSIPKEALTRWEREKADWMQRRGHIIGHWSLILPTLSAKERNAFQFEFNRTREDFLDTCCGRCLLRQPNLAQIISDSLLHFDGNRYRMGDFVVMPNHIHLLVAFPDPAKMRDQFDSWLHFTATQINRTTGEEGHFWQQEPFDHVVRSPEQYEYLRKCIADNPTKASLKPGEFLYRRSES